MSGVTFIKLFKRKFYKQPLCLLGMEFTKQILQCLNDSGKNVCITSKELSKTMRKYSPKDFPDFSPRLVYFWKNGERPIPIKTAVEIMNNNKIKSININNFSISGGNKIKFPNRETIPFCYLLGLILGDGCLIHRKRESNKNTYLIQISFCDKEQANSIKRLTKNLFDINSSIHFHSGCYNLLTHSKPLVLILNKMYQIPIGLKYSSIKVPDIIVNSNNTKIKAFLKGVFDSDGNIYIHKNKKSVQLRQKSQTFLTQIHQLFCRIDICFRNPYYDKANNSWLLWSSKKSLVDNFIKKIIDFNIETP